MNDLVEQRHQCDIGTQQLASSFTTAGGWATAVGHSPRHSIQLDSTLSGDTQPPNPWGEVLYGRVDQSSWQSCSQHLKPSGIACEGVKRASASYLKPAPAATATATNEDPISKYPFPACKNICPTLTRSSGQQGLETVESTGRLKRKSSR